MTGAAWDSHHEDSSTQGGLTCRRGYGSSGRGSGDDSRHPRLSQAEAAQPREQVLLQGRQVKAGLLHTCGGGGEGKGHGVQGFVTRESVQDTEADVTPPPPWLAERSRSTPSSPSPLASPSQSPPLG